MPPRTVAASPWSRGAAVARARIGRASVAILSRLLARRTQWPSLRQIAGRWFVAPLVALFAYTDQARAAGRLLQTIVEPLVSHEAPTFRLMVLPKPGFTEDMLATFAADGRFEVLGLSRTVVKAPYPVFLPPWVDDNYYGAAPVEFNAGKARLREFWMGAWPALREGARPDAVLTGNFAYHAEQELAAAVEASGTPFIAVHKEAMKTPGLEMFYTWLYRSRRQPFRGRRVLVYNGIERDIQIAAGTAPAERITIVGMARLDRAHRWRRAAAAGVTHAMRERPRVLFFSFHAKTGLPSVPRKASAPQGRLERLEQRFDQLRWDRLCRDCHAAVLQLARDNPGLDVVIKGKGDLLEFLPSGALDLAHQPRNLRVVLGGDPQDLIEDATVVSGFNTTALFEALAAGKRVVVPRFAEVDREDHYPYYLDLGAAVTEARSSIELQAELARAAFAPTPPTAELAPEVARMLDCWAGNADGMASARLAQAVASEIAARRQAA